MWAISSLCGGPKDCVQKLKRAPTKIDFKLRQESLRKNIFSAEENGLVATELRTAKQNTRQRMQGSNDSGGAAATKAKVTECGDRVRTPGSIYQQKIW